MVRISWRIRGPEPVISSLEPRCLHPGRFRHTAAQPHGRALTAVNPQMPLPGAMTLDAPADPRRNPSTRQQGPRIDPCDIPPRANRLNRATRGGPPPRRAALIGVSPVPRTETRCPRESPNGDRAHRRTRGVGQSLPRASPGKPPGADPPRGWTCAPPRRPPSPTLGGGGSSGEPVGLVSSQLHRTCFPGRCLRVPSRPKPAVRRSAPCPQDLRERPMPRHPQPVAHALKEGEAWRSIGVNKSPDASGQEAIACFHAWTAARAADPPNAAPEWPSVSP